MIESNVNKVTNRPPLKLKRRIVIFFALLMVGIVGVIALTNVFKSSSSSPESREQSHANQADGEVKSFDLAAVGDMLPHETVTNAAKVDGGYNYLNLISPELQKSFQKAELRFCNQEAPSAAKLGIRGYPAFNAPAQFPKDLASFGCNIISTGNNHANDGGQAGINGTLDEWDAIKPLAVSGSNRSLAEQDKLRIFEEDGVKFGFVAFTQDSNSEPPEPFSINSLDNLSLVSSQISKLRQQVDVVIVSAHWGTEDSHIVSSAQKQAAQKLAELGADIIIGSGPHVWQPYAEVRSGGRVSHVWYSIGNGLNSQTKADQLFSGVALLKITKLKTGQVQIDSPRVLPTYMHYVWAEGVGSSNAKLLARTKLKWLVLAEDDAANLIAERNDFRTSREDQLAKLKSYLANDAVKILDNY